MGQNTLDQKDIGNVKLSICLERNIEIASFLHVYKIGGNLKLIRKWFRLLSQKWLRPLWAQESKTFKKE